MNPVNCPRIPVNIDGLVEKVALIELRKKNAVVTLAFTEYVRRHHPELWSEQVGAQ